MHNLSVTGYIEESIHRMETGATSCDTETISNQSATGSEKPSAAQSTSASTGYVLGTKPASQDQSIPGAGETKEETGGKGEESNTELDPVEVRKRRLAFLSRLERPQAPGDKDEGSGTEASEKKEEGNESQTANTSNGEKNSQTQGRSYLLVIMVYE